MIPNNINNALSILPFYDSLSKQSHRKSYAQGQIFCLATPVKTVLPFQMLVPHDPDAGAWVYLNELGTQAQRETDITSAITNTGLRVEKNIVEGVDVIVNPGHLPLNIETPPGSYYLRISYKDVNYFSEVFNIVPSVENLLKISYSDYNNLVFPGGAVDYSHGFNFDVYLDTQLARPRYEYSEVVQKRDGYTFVEKQISEKTYRFTFLAPEYLCDALRLVRLSDRITIYNLGDTYNADSFLFTVDWQQGGYLAKVDAEFQTDTVIKKLGGSVPDSSADRGDFSADFSNDFGDA